MTRDPELVAVAAKVLWSHDHEPDAWELASEFDRADYVSCARDVLAAIDASGTHWVAPWEAPDKAGAWEETRGAGTYDSEELWEMWRDEWLTARRGAP